MKLLLLSDTHFHHDPSVSDFSHERKQELIRLLDHHMHDMVILNGDIFDWTQGCDVNLWKRRNPLLTLALEYCVDYRLKGNHDPIDVQIGVEQVGNSLKVGNIYITHGHLFDLFNGGSLWWVGRIASFLASRAELFHRDADDYLRRWGQSFFNYGRYGGRTAYADCAEKWLSSHDNTVLVLGHTHDPDDQITPGGRYYNTGCWCNHQHDYLLLEAPDKAEVTLCR